MMRGNDNNIITYRKRNMWTEEEDKILIDYIKANGEGRWNKIPIETGLKRCRKSCRLRWINYLSPNVKRGDFTEDENDLIIRLHKLLGNRWSLIAGRVPGRTDNQVKNHWNSILSKRSGVNGKNRKGSSDLTSSSKHSNPPASYSCPFNEVFELSATRDIRNESTCDYDDNYEIDFESISTPRIMEFLEDLSFDLDDFS